MIGVARLVVLGL
jgi:hypothetical protein